MEKEYHQAEKGTEAAEEPRAKKKKNNEQLCHFYYTIGATPIQSAEEGKGEFECSKKESQLHHDENTLVWWKTNQNGFQ